MCAGRKGFICWKRLLHCATWLLLAEMNGAGIQESYVAMETTAKSEMQRWREICTVCRDGQIFLLGSIQVAGVFFFLMSASVRLSSVE